MTEIQGDLFNVDCDWICITTNNVLKDNGKLVMGKGVALRANQLIPDLDKHLGVFVKMGYTGTNLTSKIYNGKRIVSFQTKNHWRDNSTMWLILRSAVHLREQKEMYEEHEKRKIRVALPRPGCGNGGLNWDYVKNALDPIFNSDDFIIVHNGK